MKVHLDGVFGTLASDANQGRRLGSGGLASFRGNRGSQAVFDSAGRSAGNAVRQRRKGKEEEKSVRSKDLANLVGVNGERTSMISFSYDLGNTPFS